MLLVDDSFFLLALIWSAFKPQTQQTEPKQCSVA